MYFETDPNLSQELILSFGERLRMDFYDHLADFVNEIELIDKEEFYQMHADFLSRLAMTFTHGDYARIEEIKGKEDIAEGLYKKALTYHPDHRAYLGLGIIAQKKGAYEESTQILSKGIGYFPDSEPLSICLGISFMNLGEYTKALSIFLKFQHSQQTPPYIAQCYHALGEFEKETAILKKLDSH
jgi:tetratricopeptide (TPR) repeat protein